MTAAAFVRIPFIRMSYRGPRRMVQVPQRDVQTYAKSDDTRGVCITPNPPAWRRARSVRDLVRAAGRARLPAGARLVAARPPERRRLSFRAIVAQKLSSV